MMNFEERKAHRDAEQERERKKDEDLARQREARMIPFMERLNDRYKGKAIITLHESGDLVTIQVDGVSEPLEIGLHDESSGYDPVYLTINEVATSTFESESESESES